MNNELIMEVPFFQVPNDIFELGLTTNEMMVFFYLARCGNNGKVAFPSYQTIGDKTGTSKSTAIRCVKSLTEKGLLIKNTRVDAENGRNKSNTYKVAVNINKENFDGVTQTQGVVSERHKDSVTVKHNKELSINNNIDKEISNIHTFNKPKSESEFYNDFVQIEEEFENYNCDRNTINIASIFYDELQKHTGIKHSRINLRQILKIDESVIRAITEDEIEIKDNVMNTENYFREMIIFMIIEYFKENRKYYSLQEFATYKNFEIWGTRLKQKYADMSEFNYELHYTTVSELVQEKWKC